MATLKVCKLNLVQKTEAKKVEFFWVNPQFSPSEKFQTPKKNTGCQSEVESEYSTLEDS